MEPPDVGGYDNDEKSELNQYENYSLLNHSGSCHSRMPALNCGWSCASTRKAVVVIGANVARFIVSALTPNSPPGTNFHSSPDLYSTRAETGTRHLPTPVSSNQYTAADVIFFGVPKSNWTHSREPTCGH